MNEKQQIRKLKTQIRNLKKQNKKLKKQNNQLIRKNNNVKVKTKNKLVKRQPEVKATGIFRASVHYLNKSSANVDNPYESEFIAIVYTIGRLNDYYIKRQLIMAINRYIDRCPDNTQSGLRKMFNGAFLVGFENREIGQNELPSNQGINSIKVTLEVRK